MMNPAIIDTEYGAAQLTLRELPQVSREASHLDSVLLPDCLAVRGEDPVFRWLRLREDLESAWFELCDREQWIGPGIAVYKHAWSPETDEQRRRDLIEQQGRSLRLFGLREVFRRHGNGRTWYYCVARIDDAVTAQTVTEVLGLEHDDESSRGKLMKRLSIFGPAAAAGARLREDCPGNPEYFHCLGDLPEADGQLVISIPMAAELLGRPPMLERGETRLQVWMLTPIGLIKGMAHIRDWNRGEGLMKVDLAYPEQSIDRTLRTEKYVLWKATPHMPFAVEPLAMDGLLKVPELLQRAESLTEKQSRAMSNRMWQEAQAIKEQAPKLHRDYHNGAPLGDLIQGRIWDPVAALSLAASGSVYATPAVAEMTYGGAAMTVSAAIDRWTEEETLMPGCFVSGIRGYWSNPELAGVEEPKQGYVGIIWHGDTPNGFVMNRKDFLSPEVRFGSDGGDLDDVLDGVLLESKKQKLIWLSRNPTSYKAGWMLKVQADDWKRLKALGVESYIAKPEGLNRTKEMTRLALSRLS